MLTCLRPAFSLLLPVLVCASCLRAVYVETPHQPSAVAGISPGPSVVSAGTAGRRLCLVADDALSVAARINNEAVSHCMKEEYDEAYALLSFLTDSESSYAPGWNNLGVVLEKTGNRDESLDAYLKAWYTDKHTPCAKYNINGREPGVD